MAALIAVVVLVVLVVVDGLTLYKTQLILCTGHMWRGAGAEGVCNSPTNGPQATQSCPTATP